MFSGIVAALGKISKVQPLERGARLTIHAVRLGLDDVAIGDSICVSGVYIDHSWRLIHAVRRIGTKTKSEMSPTPGARKRVDQRVWDRARLIGTARSG